MRLQSCHKMNTFILADNQELSCYALESLLRQNERNKLRRAVNRCNLLKELAAQENSVVLLDYSLFDFTGVEELLVLTERFVLTHWVLVDAELPMTLLRRVLYESQSISVVFKDSPLSTFREALHSAAEGRRFICQPAMELLLSGSQTPAEPAPLTATELAIAKAIAHGKTTKEIAAERFSSFHTVTTHRKNIFQKLKVNTAHDLMRYALHAGWIDASEF